MIRIKYSPWLCQGVAQRGATTTAVASDPLAEPGAASAVNSPFSTVTARPASNARSPRSVTSTTPLPDMTPEEWDFVMDVNCRGTFFLSQAVLMRMLERRRGRIINLGSISGERGAKYAGAHYSVSKAGVIMITKVLAKYAADSGVTVNTISPGIIATEMTQRLGTQVDPNDVPMNRMGTPEEVAQVAVFLASDMASYITGQNISVNGGQSTR